MCCHRFYAYFAVIFLCFAARAAEPTALPWDLDALGNAPATYAAPGFEEEGVKALFYDGVPCGGKPTRVFAWYGVPADGAPVVGGARHPAMVLVHGGGGTAFANWVRLWNERGYAAIAMDTCGCVPRGTYGHWERHEMGGPAGWGGFEQTDEPPADQWTYQAVADILLAHSLIRSFPEVDADRTGITGISWGGYLTCITAGVDPRFKLAAPVYGCGYLGENSAWLDNFSKMTTETAADWLRRWDPSVYLPRAQMPILWVTGTNDFAYPMDSLQKSYRLPADPRTLCIRVRMPHGHGPAGENPEEIHTFADSILNNGPPLPAIIEQGRDGNRAWVKFKSHEPVAKAELTFTKQIGKWQDRLWETASATIDRQTGIVTAQIPEGVTVYYVNVFDEKGQAVSSEHQTVE
ncbi:MAG TPA: acetylxylan esterase [Candidatus Bathyarchaeia archaeon]|nr:acetylxylan esterase [Candidatus Bathyarchaeia archaeon]